jgi:hypothetical protein
MAKRLRKQRAAREARKTPRGKGAESGAKKPTLKDLLVGPGPRFED